MSAGGLKKYCIIPLKEAPHSSDYLHACAHDNACKPPKLEHFLFLAAQRLVFDYF